MRYDTEGKHTQEKGLLAIMMDHIEQHIGEGCNIVTEDFCSVYDLYSHRELRLIRKFLELTFRFN